METDIKYTTYMPVLMEILDKTSGNVIEIGTGLFSTPFLHWYCQMRNRTLTSYENIQYWYDMLKEYASDNHTLILTGRYTPIEQQASVVLIDSFPVDERRVIAEQFKDSDYVIIHDIEMLETEFSGLFAYRKDYPEFSTSVFSNIIDLTTI